VKALTLDNLGGMTGLAGLADRSGVDIRPTLLRVLTDLYIQKSTHTPHEDQHFTELALRLIDVVDESTRSSVAVRLKSHPRAPHAVLQRLAELAPRMPQPSQHGSIELFGQGPSLDDDLGIFEPAGATAQPPRPSAPRPTPEPRPTVDYVGQRETFFSANAEDRKLILVNLEPVAVEEVAPAPETNIIRYLEQAALAGRAQEFTTLLQQGLGVSRALARRIVSDVSGEPFVVSAKALTMPTDVFQRILMSLNPEIGQSVERVFELSDLFLELPLSSALHMVAIWRAADRIEARSLLHRRAHWDDVPVQTRDRNATHEQQRSMERTTAADPSRRGTARG